MIRQTRFEQTTLICTVGGSHEPIVRAIEDARPDTVCFVCSDDDPATLQKGSYQQIQGKGSVIKARYQDAKPSLPNIPIQAGLIEEQFEVLKIQPDDFDAIYSKVSAWLAARDSGRERLVADYTGGTKTMSAALVAAALDSEGVELQLVTGSRANLIKIDSGSESTIPASVENTRLRRRLQEALALWRHYAYAEAAELLRNIPRPRDAGLRGEMDRADELSRAFAAWDRFDHKGAQDILTKYRPVLGPSLGSLFGTLDLLNKDLPGREPLRLFDLFRNAQRRAAAQRYDDAIARLYRLLEWSAQWLLRERAAIETADVPVDKIPPEIEITKNREGIYQAGLFAAWALAAQHCGDDIAAFWRDEQNTMLDKLKARNHSILAHGFAPLEEKHWRDVSGWIEDKLLPLLLSVTQADKQYRIGRVMEQLPSSLPQPKVA